MPAHNILKRLLRIFGYEIRRINSHHEDEQYEQLYRKYSGYTMLSKSTFIENLKLCQMFASVEGCIVECGVWRGGMIAAMSQLLGSGRTYYLFDSFEGLPEAKDIDGEAAKKWQSDKDSPNYYNNCKAEMNYAEAAMKLSEASSYRLIKGWFSETLPNFTMTEKIAILRLDSDWYDSTIECLSYLYPMVVPGGLVIIDDYYAWDGCSKAVHDYLSKHQLDVRLYQMNQDNCFLIKK